MATVTASYNWVSGETVTPTKLNTTAAPTVVVADNEVTTAKILDANVTTAKILDANVTNAKLASDIDASKLTAGTLPIARIADAAVTQAKLASGVTTTGPAFRAYASSTTTIANNTSAKVTLATEQWDTADCFASSRFTPNVAGYYQVNYSVRMEGATNLQANLFKNGSAASSGNLVSASGFHSTGSDLVHLNGTTDYIELFAYHFSGGNATASISSIGTFMSGFLARAA
jgi:hypothetical protein